MIKVGIVVSRDVGNNTARVSLPMQDDKVTCDLVVVSQNNFWMPNVGQNVLCIFISTSEGYIVGVA